jgi:nitrogen fixation-related uncharacterized protein
LAVIGIAVILLMFIYTWGMLWAMRKSQ